MRRKVQFCSLLDKFEVKTEKSENEDENYSLPVPAIALLDYPKFCRIPWFDTVHYIRITYSLLLTAIVIYWCILKLVYEGKEGKLRSRGGRLSHISLYVIFLGCLGILYLFPSESFLSADYVY